MAGIEAHIASPIEGLREVGMAVGQYIMNSLYPLEPDKQLAFDYQETEDVKTLLKLSKPVVELQTELGGVSVSSEASVNCEASVSSEASVNCEASVSSDASVRSDAGDGRYGEGAVKTVECSDSDR